MTDFSHRLSACPLCGGHELFTDYFRGKTSIYAMAECRPCGLFLSRKVTVYRKNALNSLIDRVVSAWNSRAGQAQKPPGKQDKYIGQRFGRRVVVAGERKKTANKQCLVPWVCDCGKTGHSTVFDLRHHETCQNCFNDKNTLLPFAG